MGLRLGFHYHVPAVRKDGGIYMPGYLGRFVDALAAHCERLVLFLHTPRSDEWALMDYRVQGPSVDLVSVGPHVSVLPRTVQALRYVIPRVRQHRAALDALLLRGPSPLLPLVAWAARPVPTVLLLVGDYLAGIDDLLQPRWRRELIRAWAHWNRWGQDRVVRQSLTFVNSRRLYAELQPFALHLVETRTTTLSEADFFVRDDTCAAPPYRLLYAGRMAAEKGLLDLLDALVLLVERGEDVILDLVGWPQKNDPILERLQERAVARGVAERVRYHGYKPVGPELFAFYRQADLFVLASRSSFEGFPRAIWEAMAHSLPVVATRVGSIPAFIQGAAELVEPRNPRALAKGIAALLRAPERRRELIQAGRTLAHQNTLEARTAELMGAVREWLNRALG